MNDFQTTRRGDLLFKLVFLIAVLLFLFTFTSRTPYSPDLESGEKGGYVLGEEDLANVPGELESDTKSNPEAEGNVTDDDNTTQESEAVTETEQQISSEPIISTSAYAQPAPAATQPAENSVQSTPAKPTTTTSENTDPETGITTITTTTNDNGVITVVTETITPESSSTQPNGLVIE